MITTLERCIPSRARMEPRSNRANGAANKDAHAWCLQDRHRLSPSQRLGHPVVAADLLITKHGVSFPSIPGFRPLSFLKVQPWARTGRLSWPIRLEEKGAS